MHHRTGAKYHVGNALEFPTGDVRGKTSLTHDGGPCLSLSLSPQMLCFVTGVNLKQVLCKWFTESPNDEIECNKSSGGGTCTSPGAREKRVRVETNGIGLPPRISVIPSR